MVERQGEFHRVLLAGRHLLNPFKDRIKVYKDAMRQEEHITINFLRLHTLKISPEAVKTTEGTELALGVELTLKVVGPADMMYFPGMAENFPLPAEPLVRDVLRETMSQISIKQLAEDVACLDRPLATDTNRLFDRRKVGLRVEQVRVLSLKAIGGDAEQINPFLAKWGS